MSDSRFILVTGATGQQGGAAVQALLRNGHRVRGLTRNPDSASARALADQGVEVVAGDFTDPDSLVRAAEGVDTLFAMTTPFEAGMDAETAQGLMLLDAARTAHVGHLIYSSVASADQQTGIPHFDSKYEVEKALAASDVPYTILAPVFFMENLMYPWMAPNLETGTLSMALPADTPLQQIATADIGAFVAALVARREAVFGHRYDIASDELTNQEVAAVLSDVLNREIRYEGFPAEALRAQNEDMGLMFEWFARTGYSVDLAALHRAFPEVQWQRFSEWAPQQHWNV